MPGTDTEWNMGANTSSGDDEENLSVVSLFKVLRLPRLLRLLKLMRLLRLAKISKLRPELLWWLQ